WGAPPEVVGAVVAWLVTSPDADALAGHTVEAQFLCAERGLLPGWGGPSPNRAAIRYDRSGATLEDPEHQLFDDGYLPQPLTLAAAVAARTRSVRIGTGIVIAPLHHPVEVAEQAAIVDIISAGRVDIGLGAGYRVPEFELFGADIAHRYGTTDQCARELRRLWSGVVTPPPVQARVPIWMGYQGPKGAARAGRLGEGLLSADGRLWPVYRDAFAAAGHDLAGARMTGGISGWATEDPEADWPVVAKHLANQLDSYRRYMVEGTGQPVPRPVDPDRLRQREPFSGPIGYFLYGTPEEVAVRVREAVGDAPVD